MMLCFSTLVQGQDIGEYQWKNRLIVVQAENERDSLALKQVEMLRGEPEALDERKLKLIISYDNQRMPVNREFQKFQVKLIGLDGNIKFTSYKAEPLSTFIDLIDAMPMRKAELRSKNN